jgi:hypothetical protein
VPKVLETGQKCLLDLFCIVKEIAALLLLVSFDLKDAAVFRLVLNRGSINFDNRISENLSVWCGDIGLVLEEVTFEAFVAAPAGE